MWIRLWGAFGICQYGIQSIEFGAYTATSEQFTGLYHTFSFLWKKKNFFRICWKLHTFHKIIIIYSIVNIATQVNSVWCRWLANLSFLFCVYGGNSDRLYKQMTLIRFELFWWENEMNELTNANEMITVAIATVYLPLTEVKMLRSSVQFGPEISICISLF